MSMDQQQEITLNTAFKPGTKEYLNELGLHYESLNDFFKAVQAYREALELDPSFKFAWFNMGTCMIQLDDFLKAHNCFDKALAIDPSFKEALYNKGFTYFREENYKKAIELFDKVLKLDPDFQEASLKKIDTYLCMKDYKNLSLEADKYLEKDYHNYIVWYLKGLALNFLGKYTEAMSSFDTSIELMPTYIEALSAKAFLAGSMGDSDIEIACYNKVLELNPSDINAWINKSNVFIRQEKYLEALKCTDVAIKIDPDIKEIWQNRLTALENLELTDEAILCKKELANFK